MNQLTQSIAILGAGAVGLSFEKYLNEKQIPTRLIKKNENARPGEIVFVCTKAFDVLNVRHQILPSNHVYIFCNGQNEIFCQQIKNSFHCECLRFGVVYFGAYILNEQVVHTELLQEKIIFGDPFLNSKSKVDQFLEEFMAWSSDMLPVLHRKWFLNCVINTLCAGLRLPRNGLLIAYPDLVEQLAAEASDLGQEIFSKTAFKKDLLWDLIEKTSTNHNSMARDLEARKKLEIDFFSGLAVGRNGYPLLKKFHSYLSIGHSKLQEK